jgi:hypothetical protein
MDTLTLLGTATGLGLVAGLRLYATVLAVGLAIRFHWFTLPDNLSHLSVLADWRILVAAGVAMTLEFLADKIPIVDSIWDTFHTVIRPLGAGLIGFAAAGSMSPVYQVLVFLAVGGIALSSHATKAGTRVMVNHSPEPFSNVGLSFVEDGLAFGGTWLAVQHPILMLLLVALFLIAFVFIARKMFHILRGLIAKLRGRFVGAPEYFGQSQNMIDPSAPNK